ncbi:MAG: trehalose synthase [Chloroflexota bacterium]|jgi:trehalose synthase|nr:trehalose synthase [Chloroflexota bacterium]
MYSSVPVLPKRFKAYEKIIGEEATTEIRELARDLKGARVLHLNATAFGGGVAELLGTLVPLMRDIGLDADWQVMHGTDRFFTVTKAMHNSLQGAVQWSEQRANLWRKYQRQNAQDWDEHYDFVVIHDPQPAGLPHYLAEAGRPLGGGLTWRCHIDLTDALPKTWRFLLPYLKPFDTLIFTHQDYVKPELKGRDIRISPPAIDPLAPKNGRLGRDTVHEILRRYGVDPERPIICQVSRFDPWKDPLGVIDVYRLCKQQVPKLQLLMIASMATDDPEGWSYFERTVRRAGEDYDIHILSNIHGVGHVEVNAFQRASEVLIQKSLREGFGLTVAEGLWKERPVVAGNVGGIPLQVQDGVSGYLVDSVEECADRVTWLLQRPELAEGMGQAGKEHVRKNFLITRYMRDYLKIFRDQAARPAGPRRAGGNGAGAVAGSGRPAKVPAAK